MKKKNGFTLVELLAVIVVLALIMIVVIPSIMKSIGSARKESFYLYAQSLQSKATAKYTQDLDLNKSNTDCAVYDISKDLDISNTGKYEGWVKINRVAVSSGNLVATASINNNSLSGVYYCVTSSGTCTPNETYYYEEGKTEVTINKTIGKDDKLCYNYKYADASKILRTSSTTCVSGRDTGSKDSYRYDVYITLKDTNYKVENLLFNKDMPMETFYDEMQSKGDLSIESLSCSSTGSETKGTTTIKTTKVTNQTTITDATTKVTTSSRADDKTSKLTTTTTNERQTVEAEKTTITTRQTYVIPSTTIEPEKTALLLNTLNVAGYDVSFSPMKFNYELTVPNSVSTLSITATSAEPETTVTVIGAEGLTIGSNIIRINLSNPNESKEANYYIQVRRLDELGNIVEVTRTNDAPIYNREEGLPDPTLPSSDASLSSLTVSGYMLEFDKNKYDYELTIVDADSLPIKYETTSSKARAYMEGNESLTDGSKISIYVTSENGYYKKAYTITVHTKKEQNIMSTFLKFLVAGLGVALLALLVIISANKRTSRKIRNKNDIIDTNNENKNI